MASKTIELNLSHKLSLTVSNTVDNANNRSLISWTLTVSDNGYWYDTYVKVTIDGAVRYNKTVGWDGGFPAEPGSTSGSFYVNHNDSGTRSVSMALEGYVYSYAVSSTSDTLTCSPTDRSALSVTTSVPSNGITHNSCNLVVATSSPSAVASTNGYGYQIKTSSGSYGSTVYNNNGQWTITGLTPNTSYTIKGWVKKASNNVWGSNETSFSTLGSATLSSVTNITLTASPTFKWTPLVASYRYKIQIVIGNNTIVTSDYITGTFVANQEYTYNSMSLTLATFAPYITTGTSATATARLFTYNGTTQIGEASSKDFIITVPQNSSTLPTLNEANISLGEGTTSGFGVLTTGYSTLRATISNTNLTAGLKYSATVNSFTMTINNKTFTGVQSGSSWTITTDTITTPGTHTVTFVLQDSRNFIVTKTKTVTFYEYFSPTGLISSEINSTNDGFITNASWNIASVGGHNSATVSMYRIRSNTTMETNTTAVNSANNNYSYEKTWNQTDISDAATGAYSYKLTITDAKNSSSPFELTINTSQICISRLGGGNGVTFFQEAEHEGFWVRDIRHDIVQSEYLELARILSTTYDSSLPYDIGIFVTQDGSIYECNTAIASGEAWNASHWDFIGTAS